jgi:anti-sigma regulatory factor (Ser/Thr protein kinase)
MDAARLLRARHRIADYLYALGAGKRTVGDVVLAVEEAMTNAVRHSASDAPIEVRLHFSGPDLHAEVRDHGRGFDVRGFDPRRVPDPLQPGGRGLYLIAQLMDDVEVRAVGGVVVRAVKRDALVADARHPRTLSAIPDGAGLERGSTYREARERSLIEEIPEGFAALDWEYCFTYANDLALATYSLEREAVLGRSIWDLFPGIKEAELGVAIRESMEFGAPSILEWDSPYLGRTLEFRIYPTSSGVSFYLRDIEERRQRERERDEYPRHFCGARSGSGPSSRT